MINAASPADVALFLVPADGNFTTAIAGATTRRTSMEFLTEKGHYTFLNAPGYLDLIKNLITAESPAGYALFLGQARSCDRDPATRSWARCASAGQRRQGSNRA